MSNGSDRLSGGDMFIMSQEERLASHWLSTAQWSFI